MDALGLGRNGEARRVRDARAPTRPTPCADGLPEQQAAADSATVARMAYVLHRRDQDRDGEEDRKIRGGEELAAGDDRVKVDCDPCGDAGDLQRKPTR